MKISEVIKELQGIIDSHGDLQVHLNCDHGQELMNANWVGVSSIESDQDYMPEYGDENEYDIKVVEIQAY